MNNEIISKRIAELRRVMSSKKLDGYIVTDSDTAGSEYPAGHFRARTWLTGFDGSNGVCLVAADRALLWTDGRYYLQAEQQLQGTGIELMREGSPGVPSLPEFLCRHFGSGSSIGVWGETCMAADYDELSSALAPRGITLCAIPDLTGGLWTSGRPELPMAPVFLLADQIARVLSDEGKAGSLTEDNEVVSGAAISGGGESEELPKRLAAVRAKLAQHDADALLVCALDSVMWLFGLRGSDVAHTPVAYARALISQDYALLFVDKRKVPDAVLSSLTLDKVTLLDYGDIMDYGAKLPAGTRLLYDPKTVNMDLRNTIAAGVKIAEAPDPIGALKAVKTGAEIAHIRQCHERDGRTMVRFLLWLETGAGKINEYEAAEKLMALRAQDPRYLSESFTPICAFGANGAIVHYQPKKESAAVIGRGGFFVVDGGGQYLDGTTDMTRTVWIGANFAGGAEASASVIPGSAKRDYTLVLKAHIALASASFRAGVAGAQLDALSRRLLWEEHLDYAHGTGHGVGYVLGVHETPPTLTSSQSAGYGARVPIEPGMVFSNEPGLYRAGEYGIRLENLVTPYNAAHTEFGAFLELETLSLCPFCRSVIEPAMLTTAEKDWLNTYHSAVYTRLAPGLTKAERAWLAEQTEAVR